MAHKCNVCKEDLKGKINLVANHWIYKGGELAEIEFAHMSCALKANEKSGKSYWGGMHHE